MDPPLFFHDDSSSRSFLGIMCWGLNLGGGGGKTPNFPKIQATRSEGCAPTDNQYRNRSVFKRISLIPALLAMGLYVPTYIRYTSNIIHHINRQRRYNRAKAWVSQYIGRKKRFTHHQTSYHKHWSLMYVRSVTTNTPDSLLYPTQYDLKWDTPNRLMGSWTCQSAQCSWPSLNVGGKLTTHYEFFPTYNFEKLSIAWGSWVGSYHAIKRQMLPSKTLQAKPHHHVSQCVSLEWVTMRLGDRIPFYRSGGVCIYYLPLADSRRVGWATVASSDDLMNVCSQQRVACLW
jgi:hypothetical protein